MTDRLEWRTVDNDGGADHHYTDRADVDDGYLLRTLQMDGEGNWLIVAEHHVKVARLLAGGETPADYVDEATFVRLCDERDALTAEVETERMRLAACGVAAQCNTEESIAQHGIDESSPYYSASYADVRAAVRREIALTAEVERLRSTIGSIGDEGDDIIAALKRERDEARAALSDAIDGVNEIAETHEADLPVPALDDLERLYQSMLSRWKGVPAPEPEETDEPGCPAEHEDAWLCTLNAGHDGEHVAHGLDGEVWATWKIDDEPAGEAVDEGAGESGQTPGSPAEGEVGAPDPELLPEPAPATPTTALLSYAPRSTSGIGISFAGSVLPLTRQPDGAFLPGCSYVLYTADTETFSFLRDARAADGMAKGTIRWRVNNGGDPFGDDKASSSKAVLLKADTVVSNALTWPAATGPISVTDLGDPLIDADGSKWWRVEAWSDESATANKSEASTRATVFFVCVLAPGVEAPRPPAIGYHASDPIVIGSPVVHPITFVTDADPSPGKGERPDPLLWQDDDDIATWIGATADPGLKGLALALHRDGFQSKRGGPYHVDRTAGHHLDLRPSNIRQPQYSALCTAVRLLTGEATAEDKAFLRLYALNNGLSAPEIAIGEHGDTTALWGGFSYDAAFEETFSVACVYSWGRRFNLWTSSEEARIRDQLARFVWTSLQLHRNPYRKWIHANGSTQAMWESARDQVSGLVALVMPDYFTEQYGSANAWVAFFIEGASHGLASHSGLYGLLSSEPRWNADPRYFTSHNCAGPLALTLTCLANAGEEVPDHYEGAFLLALDGKLPGAEGVHFWSPLMVNDHFPRLRKAILAKHGKAAVLDAAKEISTASKTDPAKPGGMGAGTAVLSLLSIDFGGA